jgi:hypothetical protein
VEINPLIDRLPESFLVAMLSSFPGIVSINLTENYPVEFGVLITVDLDENLRFIVWGNWEWSPSGMPCHHQLFHFKVQGMVWNDESNRISCCPKRWGFWKRINSALSMHVCPGVCSNDDTLKVLRYYDNLRTKGTQLTLPATSMEYFLCTVQRPITVNEALCNFSNCVFSQLFAAEDCCNWYRETLVCCPHSVLVGCSLQYFLRLKFSVFVSRRPGIVIL